MKNTLNEILSMMSRIDPSYVYEDGEGEKQENQQETDFLRGYFGDVDANTPYSDDLHFPKMVEIIDNAITDTPEHLQEIIEEIDEKYSSIDPIQHTKRVPEKGTLPNIVMFSLRSILGNKDSLMEGIDNFKNISQSIENNGRLLKDDLTILFLKLFDLDYTSDEPDYSEFKNEFISKIKAYNDFLTDGEIEYFFQKALELAKSKQNEKESLINDILSNRSLPDQAKISNARINDFIKKSSKELSKAICDDIVRYSGEKKEKEWKEWNSDTFPEKIKRHELSLTGPTQNKEKEPIPMFVDTVQQIPSGKGRKVKVNGKPKIERNIVFSKEMALNYFNFDATICGKIRSYIYFVSNIRLYSKTLRDFLFGKNCFRQGEDNKNISYENAKWDDPLYGVQNNDSNLVGEVSTTTILKLLKGKTENGENLQQLTKDIYDAISGEVNLSGKDNTLFENIQSILYSITAKNKAVKYNLPISTVNTESNDFSLLVRMMEILTMKNNPSYSLILQRLRPEDILNNGSVRDFIKREFNNNEDELASMLPSGALNTIFEDGEMTNATVVDFFQGAFSESEISSTIDKDKTNREIFEFCNKISTNYLVDKNIIKINTIDTNKIEDVLKDNKVYWYRELNGKGKLATPSKYVAEHLGNLSIDIGNEPTETAIEYQGPQHYMAEGKASPISVSCRKDEYCSKKRFDAFRARRKEYFSFISKRGEGLTGSIDDLNREFLMSIVTEFSESTNGQDKYGILINDTQETINEWITYLNGNKSKKPSRINIINCEKANTIYRWDKELEAMYQQLKDKAKPEGLPNWLFIHLVPQKYYVNETEVKEFNPNDQNFVKDRKKFAAFVYRSYYGDEGANIYAFNRVRKVGQVAKIRPDFSKKLKVLPWNREGEDKLKEIIYKRFDNKLPSKKQQTVTQNSLFEEVIKSLFES